MSNRASDADRSQITEMLRESAAEGRITIDELSERVDEAMNSKTYADLHRCLRELPEYDSYKPWQKVSRSEVEIVGMSVKKQQRKLRLVGPVIVGAIMLILLTSLSGIIAGLLLLPFKVIFYLALVTLVFRIFRFFVRSR